MDTTAPDIVFNEEGICNYCTAFLEKKAKHIAVDPEERRKVLDQLQELVYREAPHVTLYYEDQLWATRSNVHDVQVYVNEFVNFGKAWKS